MFTEDKTLIEIPCYFNVFHADKLYFKQNADALICIKNLNITCSMVISIYLSNKISFEKKRVMLFLRGGIDIPLGILIIISFPSSFLQSY